MNDESDAPQAATDTGNAETAPTTGTADWLHTQTRTSKDTPAAVPQAGEPLGAGSLGRTSIGLIIVIGLIFACGALLKRFGPYKNRGGRSLDIIASQSLGPRERVVVIEVEDTWLVLGVAPNSVNTLHTMPAGERPAPDDKGRPATNPSFSEAFAENLRRAGSRFSRDGRR